MKNLSIPSQSYTNSNYPHRKFNFKKINAKANFKHHKLTFLTAFSLLTMNAAPGITTDLTSELSPLSSSSGHPLATNLSTPIESNLVDIALNSPPLNYSFESQLTLPPTPLDFRGTQNSIVSAMNLLAHLQTASTITDVSYLTLEGLAGVGRSGLIKLPDPISDWLAADGNVYQVFTQLNILPQQLALNFSRLDSSYASTRELLNAILPQFYKITNIQIDSAAQHALVGSSSIILGNLLFNAYRQQHLAGNFIKTIKKLFGGCFTSCAKKLNIGDAVVLSSTAAPIVGAVVVSSITTPIAGAVLSTIELSPTLPTVQIHSIKTTAV